MSAAQSIERWLIQRAVRRLPEAERIEAEAEWLQHLGDLPTGWTRAGHAISLWWSTAPEPAPLTLDMDVANLGTVLLLISTVGNTVLDIRAGAPLAVVFPEAIIAVPSITVALVTGLRLRRKGKFHTFP